MKKFISLSVLFLIIIFSFLVIQTISNSNSRQLITPVSKNEKVLGITQWLPKKNLDSFEDAPIITAKSAFFIESKSGRILFSKNPNEKLPIASLVKVMTILIALEHKKMDDSFIVSKRAADIEPDKMLLIENEKLTLKELLSGIFLVSANDAAEVLAESTIGNRDEFIKLMNLKASQLGMENTFYVNPSGLNEDVNNSFSSAYDLTILTRYLIRHYPEVVDISKQEHIFLPQTQTHQDYDMYSGINLLTTYPGVLGFKTGYTPDAKYTLVTLARKGEDEVIGIILGSIDRRNEARELLDYSFKKLGY